MKKEYVVGIWCIVVGVVLFVVFSMYVGKSNKTAPADIQITNTYQLRDISKNEMIRDEARKRLVVVLEEEGLKPKGEIDFVKVLAYKPFRNHHHVIMEFTLEIVGYTGLYHSFAYLDVEEISGQYTVVDGFFNISVNPETDEKYKASYDKILKHVKSGGGVLMVDGE